MSRLGPENKYWNITSEVLKPISSFFHYMKEKRSQLDPDMRYYSGEKQKEWGLNWRNMTAEERIPYEKMSKNDRARYEKEKKEWEEDRVSKIREKRVNLKRLCEQAKQECRKWKEEKLKENA